jgi:hypothetical protein
MERISTCVISDDNRCHLTYPTPIKTIGCYKLASVSAKSEMWRLTIIPTAAISDEESSVEPYSDAECREGNHDRAADNHARRNILRIGRGSHDQVRTSSHHVRFKIAFAKEVMRRKLNSIYESTTGKFPERSRLDHFQLRDAQNPNAGNHGLV